MDRQRHYFFSRAEIRERLARAYSTAIGRVLLILKGACLE